VHLRLVLFNRKLLRSFCINNDTVFDRAESLVTDYDTPSSHSSHSFTLVTLLLFQRCRHTFHIRIPHNDLSSYGSHPTARFDCRPSLYCTLHYHLSLSLYSLFTVAATSVSRDKILPLFAPDEPLSANPGA